MAREYNGKEKLLQKQAHVESVSDARTVFQDNFIIVLLGADILYHLVDSSNSKAFVTLSIHPSRVIRFISSLEIFVAKRTRAS